MIYYSNIQVGLAPEAGPVKREKEEDRALVLNDKVLLEKSRQLGFLSLRRWIFACAGGIVFAAFDRLGYMLENFGSIWVISENPWHRTFLHRILMRLPVSIAVVFFCFLAVDFLRRREGKEKLRDREKLKAFRHVQAWLCRTLDGRYSFALLWLLYFLSFLPAFLGGFPGLFAADAPNQVGWTFSGWLTAHHPLLHTGILCSIFSLCRSLGGSDNTAAAVYTLLQMAALSGIFACISRFLRKEQAPGWLQAGTAVYLCLFPFHALMAVYTTKDTLFAGIFVLCLIQFCRMCTAPEAYFAGYRSMAAGFLCFVLLILFRNNGFHTLLLCVPFLFVYLWKYRKKLLLLSAGLILLYQFYSGPFLGLVGAEPGNAREMYSVLMQTLGRTYVAAGDIRPEEMAAIRPVLDEETLSSYIPGLSDPIKYSFHTPAFDEDRGSFLRAWIKVGLRNKKIYVDAFLNTTESFWYPNAGGEYLEFMCFDIEEGNPAYPHVQMHPLNQTFYRYYTAVGTDAAFREIPLLRELLSMGFYFWLMIFAGLYLCCVREYQKLLWILPFFTYMGTCFLGPSALLRYAYPVMLGVPILVYTMVCSQKEWSKQL